MLGVKIRHCRLRVIRHGGWSWGLDRQRLIDMASNRVPALIASLLEKLPIANLTDAHIDKLTLRLRCHADTLSAEAFSANATVTEHWRDSLSRQIREQLASESPQLLRRQSGDRIIPAELPVPAAAVPSNVQQLLSLWRGEGSLALHLQGFSLQALRVWELAWLRIRRSQALAPADRSDRHAEKAEALLRILPVYGEDLRGVRQARLHLLAELDFHSAGALRAGDAEAQLDHWLPIAINGGESAITVRERPVDGHPSHRAISAQAGEFPPRSRQYGGADVHPAPLFASSDIDTHVASALPYLVLGTLAQLGYLQALAATLESGGARSAVHSLSAALAIKLLPLDRNMDGQAKRHVINTFSLTEQPPGPQAYARFEGAFGALLSAADAGIYAGLLAGHGAGSPLLVHDRNPGWMLFDTQGMFPLTVAGSSEALKRALQPYRDATVLVPGACLSRTLVETILAAGGAFLTDAEPARDEPWIAVDRARRFHSHRDRPVASALTRRFDLSRRAAMALLEEHLPARRVLPECPQTGLDVSAELAAGAGLADLAYLLWGDREATHPLLAYRRLHDLEARVRVDRERVRVSLALGQRFFDLRDKGVLQDVAGVPWFGGRTLMFSGL